MRIAVTVILALAMCLAAAVAAAQGYSCRGVLANGAARCTGASYSATGVVGQHAVGLMSGAYISGAGFWQQSGVIYAGVPAEENPAAVPVQFWLGGSQPNPLSNSALVRFGVPMASQVTIKVYDAQGREAATLVDGRLGPGYHSATIDGRELASGVYFCRMDADRFCATHKLLVVR